MKAVLFFVSCFLAFVGGHITNYSVIIYAQEIFDSDLLSGVGFALCFGPPVILGWIAGVYSDKLPPSYLVMGSQMIFVGVGALFFVMHGMAPDAWAKVALFVLGAFLTGVGWSFISPSRFAALAQIVSEANLHRATVIFNLLIMIGFGLAPLLIASLKVSYGWAGVFSAISLLFFVATLMIVGIRTSAVATGKQSVRDHIRVGLQGVLSTPLLWQLLICSMLVYSMMGPMQVLLPRFAVAVLSFSEYQRGWFLGVLALSLICGGILSMLLAKRVPAGRAIGFCIVTGALAIGAISQATGGIGASLILLAAGIAGGFAVSLIVAGLQEQSPMMIRGRVMSIYTITSQVLPAVSGLLAGVASQYLGVVSALMLCGGLIAMLALIAMTKLLAVKSYHLAHET